MELCLCHKTVGMKCTLLLPLLLLGTVAALHLGEFSPPLTQLYLFPFMLRLFRLPRSQGLSLPANPAQL